MHTFRPLQQAIYTASVSLFQTFFLLCLEFKTLSPSAQTRMPSMMEVTLNLKQEVFFPSVSATSKLVTIFTTLGIFLFFVLLKKKKKHNIQHTDDHQSLTAASILLCGINTIPVTESVWTEYIHSPKGLLGTPVQFLINSII